MSGTITDNPIQDLTWMKQMLSGRVRERFAHDRFRVVSVELSPASGSPYRFRMLFFPAEGSRPVASVNLETSILGSSCITLHAGATHTNLGHTDSELPYDSFRRRSLEEFGRLLPRSR